MSELVFVRHGQASFGKASYDKLSDKGIEQAKILGRHWQALDLEFDAIYSGSLLRQRETAHELLATVKGSPPQSTVIDAFNEYNGDPLIRIYVRDHAAADGFDTNISWPIQDESLFQALFDKATERWIDGRLTPQDSDEGYESWEHFQNRVHGAIDDLMAKHGSGSNVLISTSGGVIAMALQRAIPFPDHHVIFTNWMVHNSSVTRIRYGKGRLSMSQFNNIAHLEDPALKHMISYR